MLNTEIIDEIIVNADKKLLSKLISVVPLNKMIEFMIEIKNKAIIYKIIDCLSQDDINKEMIEIILNYDYELYCYMVDCLYKKTIENLITFIKIGKSIIEDVKPKYNNYSIDMIKKYMEPIIHKLKEHKEKNKLNIQLLEPIYHILTYCVSHRWYIRCPKRMMHIGRDAMKYIFISMYEYFFDEWNEFMNTIAIGDKDDYLRHSTYFTFLFSDVINYMGYNCRNGYNGSINNSDYIRLLQEYDFVFKRASMRTTKITWSHEFIKDAHFPDFPGNIKFYYPYEDNRINIIEIYNILNEYFKQYNHHKKVYDIFKISIVNLSLKYNQIIDTYDYAISPKYMI